MSFQSSIHWTLGADRRTYGSSPAVYPQEGRELQGGVDVGVTGPDGWEVGGKLIP